MFFKKKKLLIFKKMRKEKISEKENYYFSKKKKNLDKKKKNDFSKMKYKKFEELFLKGLYLNKEKTKFKKPLSFVLKKKNFKNSISKKKNILISKEFKKLRDFSRKERSYIINRKSCSILKKNQNFDFLKNKENFEFSEKRFQFYERKRRTKSAFKLVQFLKRRIFNGEIVKEKFKDSMIISKM